MSLPQKVFVDSDVIISSLISEKGAAYLLLNQPTSIPSCFFISNFSVKEIKLVNRNKALKLDFVKFKKLLKTKVKVIRIKRTIENIKKTYGSYVVHLSDAHVIAGAAQVNARFLITYNLKHYYCEKIKRGFNIIVTTPGIYLQYLRSIS